MHNYTYIPLMHTQNANKKQKKKYEKMVIHVQQMYFTVDTEFNDLL